MYCWPERKVREPEGGSDQAADRTAAVGQSGGRAPRQPQVGSAVSMTGSVPSRSRMSVKVSRTVLKTSRGGDPPAESARDRLVRHTGPEGNGPHSRRSSWGLCGELAF